MQQEFRLKLQKSVKHLMNLEKTQTSQKSDIT